MQQEYGAIRNAVRSLKDEITAAYDERRTNGARVIWKPENTRKTMGTRSFAAFLRTNHESLLGEFTVDQIVTAVNEVRRKEFGKLKRGERVYVHGEPTREDEKEGEGGEKPTGWMDQPVERTLTVPVGEDESILVTVKTRDPGLQLARAAKIKREEIEL